MEICGIVSPSGITGIIVAVVVIIRQLALRNAVGFHFAGTAIGVYISKYFTFQRLFVLVGLLSEIGAVRIGTFLLLLLLIRTLRPFHTDLGITGIDTVAIVIGGGLIRSARRQKDGR